MQDAHVSEGGADVAEAADDRVVKLQVLKTCENFASDLQVVARRVHSQLNLREQSQLRDFDAPERHAEEFFIQIDNILDLLLIKDLEKLVSDVRDHKKFLVWPIGFIQQIKFVCFRPKISLRV